MEKKIDKEFIFKNRKITKVTIEPLEIDMYFRKLTAKDVKKFEKITGDAGVEQIVDLMIATAVTEDGKQLYTEKDKDMLLDLDVDTLAFIAEKLNGVVSTFKNK
jgi:hypothetical protein